MFYLVYQQYSLFFSSILISAQNVLVSHYKGEIFDYRQIEGNANTRIHVPLKVFCLPFL